MKRMTSMAITGIALCLILPLLSGCGGDDESDPAVITPPPPPPPPGNNAPSISGTPSTSARIGDTYTFTPSASDPDGDQLSFSVENLPRWANFDSSSGAIGVISGTLSPGDEGDYTNIVVSVFDGALSASLPGFSVTVTQVGLGSATLSWTPPTHNEDGSTVVLTAYKFYYGTSSGNYTNQVRVDSPGIASYVIGNLTPDTYYFVATAINSINVESRLSNEASKVVPPM